MKQAFDLGDLETVARKTYDLMVEEYREGSTRWNRAQITTQAVQSVVFQPSEKPQSVRSGP